MSITVSCKRQVTVSTAPLSVTRREQRVLFDYTFDFEDFDVKGKWATVICTPSRKIATAYDPKGSRIDSKTRAAVRGL